MVESNLLPVFGIIMDIIWISNECYFVCKKLHTECFISHFHSYEVSENPSDIILRNHSDLADYNVLSYYTLSSRLNYYICLKHHLVEDL